MTEPRPSSSIVDKEDPPIATAAVEMAGPTEDRPEIDAEVEIKVGAPNDGDDVHHEEEDESLGHSDTMSITDLVNLDNISAHNLYLGTEIKRLGGSGIINGDSDSMLVGGTDDEQAMSMASSVAGSLSPMEIDYSALDKFGFIVLGEDKDGDEEKAKKKQYVTMFY